MLAGSACDERASVFGCASFIYGTVISGSDVCVAKHRIYTF